MDEANWHEPERHFLGMAVYAPRRAEEDESERAVVYCNAGHVAIEAVLPQPRPGHRFSLALRSDEAAARLGIPDNVKQAGLLPVAYTLGTNFKPAKRRPLDDILHWNGW